MEQKYIKASDVAEMFGVTRQTIRNWIDNLQPSNSTTVIT